MVIGKIIKVPLKSESRYQVVEMAGKWQGLKDDILQRVAVPDLPALSQVGG
jgi:hypothetical protein